MMRIAKLSFEPNTTTKEKDDILKLLESEYELGDNKELFIQLDILRKKEVVEETETEEE